MSDRGHLCRHCGEAIRNSGIVCSVYCTCNLRKQRDLLNEENRGLRVTLSKAHTLLHSREGESFLDVCLARMRELHDLRKKVKNMGDGVSRDCERSTCVQFRRAQVRDSRNSFDLSGMDGDQMAETFAVRWMGETLDPPNMPRFEAELKTLIEAEKALVSAKKSAKLAKLTPPEVEAWKEEVFREALRVRSMWGVFTADDVEAAGGDESVVKLIRVIDRLKQLRKESA